MEFTDLLGPFAMVREGHFGGHRIAGRLCLAVVAVMGGAFAGVVPTIPGPGIGVSIAWAETPPKQVKPAAPAKPASTPGAHRPAPRPAPRTAAAHALPPLLTPAQEKAFASALAAADRAQWSDARQAAAATGQRVAAKYVEWMYLRDINNAATFEEIAAFIATNPGWPDLATMRRRAEERLLLDTPPKEVLAFFAKDRPITGDGALRHLDALALSTPTDKLAPRVRDYWINTELNPGHEQGFLTSYAAALRPQDFWARLDRLLWDDDATDARRIVPLVDADHQALAAARMALMAKDANAEQAVAVVPASLQKDPGLLFDRVRYLRRSGRDSEAQAILLTLKGDGNHDRQWWIERGYQAREMLAASDYAGAYEVARRLGASSGGAFADSEWLSGWIALRFLKRPTDALHHFQTMYEGVGMPISRARGAYWAGRAEEAAGKTQEANAWYAKAARYGDTYYGQLAVRRLGARNLTLPVDPPISAEQRAAFNRNELVLLARLLHQVGEARRARQFLVRLTIDAHSASERRLIAELALQMGRPDIALQVAKKSVEGGTPLRDASFPAVSLGGNLRTDRSLAMALARQESQFDSRAVSSAGAMGLMQLLPDTARKVAKSAGLPFAKDRLIADPNYNATLGSAYLAEMLEKFGGSFELAIAAYNAGPNRVSQWLDDFGDPRGGQVDPVDWVELIPYRETRNYVQRVLEGFHVYRQLLAEPVAMIAPAGR